MKILMVCFTILIVILIINIAQQDVTSGYANNTMAICLQYHAVEDCIALRR